MKLSPSEFIQWHDGRFTIITVNIDERLPLFGQHAPRGDGPWWRECYACGLDDGRQHYNGCPWVEWMNLAKKTIL